MGPDFRVGRVLGTAWTVYMKNFTPFSLVALVLLLPLLFFQLFVLANPSMGGDEVAKFGVYAILSIVLTQLVTATVVYGTIQELRQHSVSAGEALTRGLATALPVLGVAIVASTIVIATVAAVLFAVTIATDSALFSLLLAIIPGITLFVMFWLAVPVAVVEGPGVFASLKRSVFLTKGNRWRILGLFVVLWLIYFLISMVMEVAFMATGALGIYPYIGYVLAALFTVMFAVVSAVGYHDLRRLRDGVDIDGIGAAFD